MRGWSVERGLDTLSVSCCNPWLAAQLHGVNHARTQGHARVKVNQADLETFVDHPRANAESWILPDRLQAVRQSVVSRSVGEKDRFS